MNLIGDIQGNYHTLRALLKQMPDEEPVSVGDMVDHSIFGAGKIMVLSGTGENHRVGVIFKDGTKKKLIVKYANLSKIS